MERSWYPGRYLIPYLSQRQSHPTMTQTITTPFAPITSSGNGEFLWSLERYHHAIEHGTLTEDDKVELLYGKLIEIMPAGTLHEECVTLLDDFFRDRFGGRYRYRQEKSVSLPPQTSEPEPDFAVVAKKKYGRHRPVAGDVYLIVEVASSSLEKDRTSKASLYAAAALPEYWIVNLPDRQIEVYTKPAPDSGRYYALNTHHDGETFTSPFAGEVTVAELLPDAEEE